MRIQLQKGKQKELILKAKEGKTWKDLAETLNIGQHYLATDLKNERTLIHDSVYERLCKISDCNFDEYILSKLEDNWGRSKGGKNSTGSTIEVFQPKKDEKFAELIGAILGDGNVTCYKKDRAGVYQIKIAGDYNADKKYHTEYLSPLCEQIFGIGVKHILYQKKNERFLTLSSKKIVELLQDEGLKAGDKIKNQVTIPRWVMSEPGYMQACLRGLIDTDGCIHRMSRKNPNLIRIQFKNYNKTLLSDAHKAFTILGYHPSKITSDNKAFFISRKEEINKYLKEIGFSNNKHLERLKVFKAAP